MRAARIAPPVAASQNPPVYGMPMDISPQEMMDKLREEMHLEVAAAKEALREELRAELGLPTSPQTKEELCSQAKGSQEKGEDAALRTTELRLRRGVASSIPQSSPDSDSEEIKLETSLWMMPLFVGSGAFGAGASALLFMLLVANVIVQYMFAFIVRDTMIQPFHENYVNQLLSWRRTTAHDATFYNPILKQSLAMRVCKNDYSLIYGNGQRDLYNDLLTYLGKNGDGQGGPFVEGGAQGPTMCFLALLAFLLVISREVNATVRVSAAVLALPRGGGTTLNLKNGELAFERLSYGRLTGFLLTMTLRTGVCVLLAMYGCEFLVHTISIGDLLLNAVALEFVLNMDELIFEALAPSRVLRLVDTTKPLAVPKAMERHWRGFDLRAATTLLAVGGTVAAFVFVMLIPNVTTLTLASDALCGGDIEFVTTVDGAGVPAWAHPDSARPSEVARRGFPDGAKPDATLVKLRSALPSDAKFYSERVFDVVAQQFGKDVQQKGEGGCTDDVCFFWKDGIHQSLPSNVTPGCCVAKKVQVPSVDAGPFSILKKASETTEDAVRLWNPSCTDTISFAGGYTNLLRGGLGDTVNSEMWTIDAGLCGGACSNDKPLCAEGVPILVACSSENPSCGDAMASLAARAKASRAAGDHGCIEPYCVDVAPLCNLNTASGVRARQLCPSTCGCDDPHAPLALSLPSGGCGEQCARSGAYLERRAALPCSDMNRYDPRWTGLMADFERVRQTWPADWAFSSSVFFADLRLHGCAALRNFTDPPTTYPMHIFSINLCVEHGSYYPIKPLSYYCPQACNCHAGDAHCPDACPQRTPSSPICLPFQAKANFDPVNMNRCPVQPTLGA